MDENFYFELKSANLKAKARIGEAKSNALTEKIAEYIANNGAIISEEKAIKKIVRFLKAGANINHSSGWRKILIQQAIILEYHILAEMLVKFGCDIVNVAVIPVVCTKYKSEKEIIDEIDYYLGLGANINLPDRNSIAQQTGIHYAAEDGKEEVLKHLIAKGANLDIKNGCGDTPLELAINKGKTGCAKILQEAGASFAMLQTSTKQKAKAMGLKFTTSRQRNVMEM